MVIEVKRIEKSWEYEVPGFGNAHIEVATLGKNKGKTFLVSEDYTKVAEIHVIEKHTVKIPFNEVNVADKIEIIRENLLYNDVFFEVARKTKFDIEGSKSFEGFTFNQYWNGWECPMFELDVAMEIIKEFNNDEEKMSYDKEKDVFLFEHEDFDDGIYVVEPHDIFDEEGKTHHVYDIGAGYWVWSETEEDEEESEE